jgi:hypothetical protein
MRHADLRAVARTTLVSAIALTYRRPIMSRRPLVLLSVALASLSLAACSDVTAPTSSSQRQIKPAAASADVCVGGTFLGTGKAC